jgi:hypothetical protein
MSVLRTSDGPLSDFHDAWSAYADIVALRNSTPIVRRHSGESGREIERSAITAISRYGTTSPHRPSPQILDSSGIRKPNDWRA